MIGKLDILFYGADGKKKYQDNKVSNISKTVFYVLEQMKQL